MTLGYEDRMPPDPPSERLQGSVERVTFHSEASGFCVLRVKVKGQRDLVTVIGSAASITPGEYVECEGSWVNDRQHGLQFKTPRLRIVPPSTLEGMEKYLGSGMVNPAVFHYVGYDTDRYTGFAFGMGIERIAMLKYGVEDIRKLYENDIRFLRQF